MKVDPALTYDKGPLQLLLVEAKLNAGHDEQARKDIAFWTEVLTDPDEPLVYDPANLRISFAQRGWITKEPKQMTPDEAYAEWRERLIQARVEEQLAKEAGDALDHEVACMTLVSVAQEPAFIDRYLGDSTNTDSFADGEEIQRRLAEARNKDANQ